MDVSWCGDYYEAQVRYVRRMTVTSVDESGSFPKVTME